MHPSDTPTAADVSPSSSEARIPALTASDWVASRGEKWRAHAPRLEAKLRPIDAPLIGALRLDSPYRIAEVGCGGGATTLEIHRQAPAGSTVRGYDIVPGLIELARERASGSGPGIDFEVANVATVRPEQPYDRLVSRFGVMFFDDPAAAFGNLFEWLAPGGRFAMGVWGPLADNAWMTALR